MRLLYRPLFQVCSKVSAITRMSKLTLVSSNKCFGGEQRVYSHESSEVNCTMKFGVFLPSDALDGKKLPVFYWLSGLTCTEQNFITKAGGQRLGAKFNFIIVNPDTSPRGCNIEGEDDSYDFGSGAGFYVDSTTDKWKKNYRMYSYITKELPALVNENFPSIPDRIGISGHSMGGHGALISALKNPGMFRSVSAFAPISHPTKCAWGKKCFGGYLGSDENVWREYDATELVKSYNGPPLDILVDQGAADNFLKEGQLLPERLMESCAESKMPCVMRMQEGYDHSYFFVSTFMEDHFAHHAKFLNN
ncbi:S-formylglutathione hydrolase isoform X1 [Aplysia californica]|uniref:S-formylglutathione hydrolase n=1 Tax=Aplysia californica TaxID=6500 RepID=A0ABM0K9M5_APLCA|nr:S-formylglutathione hydrolase isoform X4 [Aplysia californica]XP_005112241.1 S-formylglutathione hydrolase isoform X1 [Aplysia californica]